MVITIITELHKRDLYPYAFVASSMSRWSKDEKRRVCKFSRSNVRIPCYSQWKILYIFHWYIIHMAKTSGKTVSKCDMHWMNNRRSEIKKPLFVHPSRSTENKIKETKEKRGKKRSRESDWERIRSCSHSNVQQGPLISWQVYNMPNAETLVSRFVDC